MRHIKGLEMADGLVRAIHAKLHANKALPLRVADLVLGKAHHMRAPLVSRHKRNPEFRVVRHWEPVAAAGHARHERSDALACEGTHRLVDSWSTIFRIKTVRPVDPFHNRIGE